MHDDARTLIAQHAKTAQLLGVDFLPLGTVPPGLAVQTDEPSSQTTNPQVSVLGSEPTPAPSFAPSTGQTIPSDIQPASSSELREAYESASSQQNKLDALKAKYEHDAPHQHFNTTFQNIVFGEGDPNADLMFVGEAPGEQEDSTGRPFVGRAGQLLENMIKAMGLSRETVYIANVLKVRPPGNATPTAREAALCSPYLMEQIRIISPKVIVTLGLPASHLLLETAAPMRSMRGNWHTLPAHTLADGIPKAQIMPTYHPAYLLRSYTEDNRRKVWSDLTQVMQKLGLSQ
ncbi:MAG: uracil-DNA glycosylase [Phycisphaerales bacterium]|nr:uracil-DNA glycosylase [Phycisphaerales bacterium]